MVAAVALGLVFLVLLALALNDHPTPAAPVVPPRPVAVVPAPTRASLPAKTALPAKAAAPVAPPPAPRAPAKAVQKPHDRHHP
jgi:hypothetical protein